MGSNRNFKFMNANAVRCTIPAGKANPEQIKHVVPHLARRDETSVSKTITQTT